MTTRAVRSHRGPILRIRRAFEQMRTVERFRRGQRDGDEIDLDAVIEARVADLEGSAWPFALGSFDGVVVTNYLHRPLFGNLVASLRADGVLRNNFV